MIRGHQERIALRRRIIGRHESGMSPTEVARDLGIARDTVYLWTRRWEEEGNLNDRRKTGRPRKTTAEQDGLIREAAQTNPFTTAVTITQNLNIPISSRTTFWQLNGQGIRHRTPAIKEALTDRHREGRLQFAREYVNKGMDFWSRVVFSDENTFASSTHGKIHCWRQDNTRYAREHIYEEARSGHITCNL